MQNCVALPPPIGTVHSFLRNDEILIYFQAQFSWRRHLANANVSYHEGGMPSAVLQKEQTPRMRCYKIKKQSKHGAVFIMMCDLGIATVFVELLQTTQQKQIWRFEQGAVPFFNC